MVGARLAAYLASFFTYTGADFDGIEGVTFCKDRTQLYLPLREAAQALELPVEWDAEKSEVVLGQIRLPERDFVLLFDGTKLVPLGVLKRLGATVDRPLEAEVAQVSYMGRDFAVREGEKRVEVSIKDQRLRAWQGSRLVLETNISSGRRGHSTPRGLFKAGPVKERMHYSRLYDDSPMPWSVQIYGHVFIHGYHSVPRRPASHGCIRMPIRGRNAARWFYGWVDVGTPVSVQNDFSQAAAVTGAK